VWGWNERGKHNEERREKLMRGEDQTRLFWREKMKPCFLNYPHTQKQA